MKTEAEIRKHLQDLVVARQIPCGCRKTVHAAQCVVGGKMMDAAIETMRWCLGENREYQDMVDRMEGDVSDYISRG